MSNNDIPQSPSANSRPLTGPMPKLVAPSRAIDTHMHIFPDGFSAQPGGPPILEFATLQDYSVVQQRLGVNRTVVVQANAHQLDNSALVRTLETLAPEDARGVAAVAPGTPAQELKRLDDVGVRAARIMEFPGGAVKINRALAVEKMVRDLDWSLIVQFNGQDMAEHLPTLEALEGDYVIDHIGKFIPPVAPDDARIDDILRLLDRGNVWVKICACYEASLTGAPEYTDVGAIAKRIIAHAPERILWGSNWPHVGVTRDKYPDDAELLDILLDWATEEQRLQMLVENPERLYFRR